MKTYDELVSLFEEANLAFLQGEHSLFRTEVAERTLCGVLMLHIHDIIKEDDSYSGYYTDVEYNRNAGGIKTIRKTIRGQQEEIIPINLDSHHPNISPVISGYKQPSKSAQSIEITGFIEKSKPPEIIFFYTLLPLTA